MTASSDISREVDGMGDIERDIWWKAVTASSDG